MTKQEQLFFEYFDQWQALADKYDVSVYTIVNARQIWDFAYVAGKTEGVNEMYAIANNVIGKE